MPRFDENLQPDQAKALRLIASDDAKNKTIRIAKDRVPKTNQHIEREVTYEESLTARGRAQLAHAERVDAAMREAIKVVLAEYAWKRIRPEHLASAIDRAVDRVRYPIA
jgi:hypothetical protein